jgi:rhodanese-related sulfurtransferase
MTTITAEEVKARFDAGEIVNLLDVREPDERAVFNIGGHFIPLGNVQAMMIDDIDALKNEEVICYCRSGKRSMMACMTLETFGFTNVKNLNGGMMDWEAKYVKAR